ncbi:leucine-rich repeat domain-containing protein [Microscilla marina]|uniref:Leucine-rich repeat containing protein n=1 Tax=Microscilla marina ATCC 23134 TaxID=313606 RepID=A1ZZ91_MICM2|nr:leucine-rich repeat domain-containing protein [Microscilla marina]EAY24292.1 leucine-rich repeat containing protein [Microscilla marina ATCC 23134]
MMYKYFGTFICWMVALPLNAQLLSAKALQKVKPFVSLETALKAPEKVIKLDLWNADLAAFPKEVFQLKNLQALNLNFNQLKEVPTEIAQLKYLQELRLGHNQLTSYPAHLSALPHLRVLDLHGNRLPDIPAAIAKLTLLEELHLHENQLTNLNSAWTTLAKLRFVNLSENQLKTLSITAQHSLKHLNMLILIKNRLKKKQQKQLQKLLPNTTLRF